MTLNPDDLAFIEAREAASEIAHFIAAAGHFAPEEREAMIRTIEAMGRKRSHGEATRAVAKVIAARLREG